MDARTQGNPAVNHVMRAPAPHYPWGGGKRNKFDQGSRRERPSQAGVGSAVVSQVMWCGIFGSRMIRVGKGAKCRRPITGQSKLTNSCQQSAEAGVVRASELLARRRPTTAGRSCALHAHLLSRSNASPALISTSGAAPGLMVRARWESRKLQEYLRSTQPVRASRQDSAGSVHARKGFILRYSSRPLMSVNVTYLPPPLSQRERAEAKRRAPVGTTSNADPAECLQATKIRTI